MQPEPQRIRDRHGAGDDGVHHRAVDEVALVKGPPHGMVHVGHLDRRPRAAAAAVQRGRQRRAAVRRREVVVVVAVVVVVVEQLRARVAGAGLGDAARGAGDGCGGGCDWLV